MKKLLITLILIFLTFSVSSAPDVGLSFSHFAPASRDSFLPEGSYARVGLLSSVAPRFEAELAASVQITPRFASSVLYTAQISYALMSSVFTSDEVALYPNMFLAAGGFYTEGSYGPLLSFTPLATGGPQHLRKERFATFSLMWDIPSDKVGLFLQLYGIDFYL